MKFTMLFVTFSALSTLAVGCAVPTGQEDVNEGATTAVQATCKNPKDGSSVSLSEHRDAKGRLRISLKIQDNAILSATAEGITIEIKGAAVVNGRKSSGSKIIYDLGKLDGIVPTMTSVEGGLLRELRPRKSVALNLIKRRKP
jgi:hypothetical protein